MTVLNGAQNLSSLASNELLVKSLKGHGIVFPSTGTLLIRDNILTYTGITLTGVSQAANTFKFTGVALASGTGGSVPDDVDVVLGFVGGFGMQTASLGFATEFWAAGLRLQEKLVALMNGDGTRALTVAPYWFQYDDGDGTSFPANSATASGGVGFSASLVGVTTLGGSDKYSERSFYWAENDWADWASAGTSSKAPTKRFLFPRLYAKMPASSVESGQLLDATLRLRWVV
jgi:hypothetical protein